MNRRRKWLIPLGLLGFLLGMQSAAAQNTPDEAKPQAVKAAKKVLTARELAAFIDQQVMAKLAQEKITPAPLASDAEFLRRVYLDLAGRIPKVADVRSFFESKADNKREKLIEDLLDNPQYVDHFSNTWQAVILQQEGNPQTAFFNTSFRTWLIDKVRNNTPYNKVVYEILTTGTTPNVPGKPNTPYYGNFNNGAYAFFQINQNKPENLAAATSRLFLGVRLECAQCHDHPFTDWKKDQFWEFAAFFTATNVNQGGIVLPNQPKAVPVAKGTINIPGTNKKVNAKFLDGKVPAWKDDTHQRVTLAEWVTSNSNPYFARAAVNRIWAQLFGIGLVDPVDEEPTKDNPPSHPELLKKLSEQFIAHEYDVQFLIRAITLSQTYQRTSKLTHASQKSQRAFAKMPVRGMTAAQLFDSLVQATGFQEPSMANPYAYNPNSIRGKFLQDFASTDGATETQTSILQALKLMNGQLTADATSLEKSQTLTAAAEAPFFDTAERINVLYLATLTRSPRPDELTRLTTYVNSGGPTNNQKAALADVFWALINCSEFKLNH